jgi:hypothetical protein
MTVAGRLIRNSCWEGSGGVPLPCSPDENNPAAPATAAGAWPARGLCEPLLLNVSAPREPPAGVNSICTQAAIRGMRPGCGVAVNKSESDQKLASLSCWSVPLIGKVILISSELAIWLCGQQPRAVDQSVTHLYPR